MIAIELFRISGKSGGLILEDGWMKVKEVAAYLQISKDLIYKWAQQGKIPVSKIGNQWRFNKEEVDQWARSQRPAQKKTQSSSSPRRTLDTKTGHKGNAG
jgi:excisionase family DNA binding protein